MFKHETVSVNLIKKWRHFVSPKTLLRFRVKVRGRVTVRAGVSVNTFSIKCSRST